MNAEAEVPVSVVQSLEEAVKALYKWVSCRVMVDMCIFVLQFKSAQVLMLNENFIFKIFIFISIFKIVIFK